MALVEYLYVDQERLDTYFEQISSPITYDKVPMWNAEISLIGPKAGGAQQRFARPYTTHEKILRLIVYVEDEGLVGYGRADGQKIGLGGASSEGNEKEFRIETCRAKRVFIPPNHGQPPGVGELKVWISAVPRTPQDVEEQNDRRARGEWPGRDLFLPGNLYLLEDYRRADEPRHDRMSSYSALSLMIGDFPLPGHGDDHPHRQYFEGLRSLRSPLERRDWPDLSNEEVQFWRAFFWDPARALLERLGAQVGPERTIRTLYRVRVHFPEEELAWTNGVFDVATFGYPIFIAESTDPPDVVYRGE
jgi:hypothetical protein